MALAQFFFPIWVSEENPQTKSIIIPTNGIPVIKMVQNQLPTDMWFDCSDIAAALRVYSGKLVKFF